MAMNIPPPFNYAPCNPIEDAPALRAALKGSDTDHLELIRIVCNRSREQLVQVAASYQSMFDKKLHDVFKTETDGKLRKVLLRRFQPPILLKVKVMNTIMQAGGANNERLIDCLVFASNSEIPHLKQIYNRLTGKDLVTSISSETSGQFKDALRDILEGNRDEGTVNMKAISEDVERLYKAGEGKIGTDEKAFIKVLCNHAPWYNMTLNVEYAKAYKQDLRKAIEKEFSGDLQKLLVALTKSPYEYWADRLVSAMKPGAVDDKSIVFITTFLDRHELQHVGKVIRDKHQKEFKQMIKEELSGDYMKAVLELCGY